MKKTAIIGGGASGLAAAVSAAGIPDNKVTVFERQQRVCRKLLATGNGRCNLTNIHASAADYHGADVAFAAPALAAFSPEAVLALFSSLGLVTVTQYGGRVYPLSDSANSVADILRYSCETRGVSFMTASPVMAILRSGGRFCVKTAEDSFLFDNVIVACGGMAGGKLGGTGDGYSLLSALGHTRTKLYPALVPISTENEYPRALKGIRCDAELSLIKKSSVIARSRGELQFTETGISGPAAFDISRDAALNDSCTVKIDFLADYSRDDVLALLLQKQISLSNLQSGEILTGVLHNRLGRMLVKYSGADAQLPISALSGKALDKITSACKEFRLDVKGVGGFDAAQITVGGISTKDFRADTLESRIVPGLYACGEVLDIDGPCGGYNLQWAWASGFLAGRLG